MKRFALLATAALLAVPAVFAQTATVITSNSAVLVEPPPVTKPLRGAVIAEAPTVVAPGTVAVMPATTVLGGPAAVVTTTSPSVTVVNHYWNVPSNIDRRMDFARWRRLL